MTEYPRSEIPSEDVTDINEFRSAHHPDTHLSIQNPETEPPPDSVFAARLLDAWAQLPKEVRVSEHILYDAADDERLSLLISDESITAQGATLHYTGQAFATTMRGYDISPEQIQALEIMYRTHFIYQKTQQPQPVQHPMAGVIFQRIIEESQSSVSSNVSRTTRRLS